MCFCLYKSFDHQGQDKSVGKKKKFLLTHYLSFLSKEKKLKIGEKKKDIYIRPCLVTPMYANINIVIYLNAMSQCGITEKFKTTFFMKNKNKKKLINVKKKNILYLYLYIYVQIYICI